MPRASLSDAVYERLRDAIMDGEFPDGARLNQVELAERFGVSRIPIREALRRLQAESLVVSTPYYPFVIRKVGPAQVLELVDIRAVLEDLALSRREPPTADEIAELRRLNAEMARSRNAAGFFGPDREFHRLVAGSSTMIAELVDDVRDKVHRHLSSMLSAKPGRKAATEEHARLVDALEAGDMALARRVLYEHVMQSRAFIVGRLDADDAPPPPAPLPALAPERRERTEPEIA